MNSLIESGEAVRIAHYEDLDAGRAAVRAWGEQETLGLVVPIPGSLESTELHVEPGKRHLHVV
jgi:hypothetical protein